MNKFIYRECNSKSLNRCSSGIWWADPYIKLKKPPKDQNTLKEVQLGNTYLTRWKKTHTKLDNVVLVQWQVKRPMQYIVVQLLSCVWLLVHGLQHARLICPSLSPGVCSNSHPLRPWSIVSSFVIPFSSCLPSFLASGSFPKSQFFASGGQSTGVSASASVLPMNIQGWFPLGLIGLISLIDYNRIHMEFPHIYGNLILLKASTIVEKEKTFKNGVEAIGKYIKN